MTYKKIYTQQGACNKIPVTDKGVDQNTLEICSLHSTWLRVGINRCWLWATATLQVATRGQCFQST